MSAHDWIPIIASGLSAIPACMGAFTAWLAFRTSRENRAAIQITNNTVAAVADKVEAVHLATNSMKDQLVAATDAAAHARGISDATDAAANLANALAVAHAEGKTEGQRDRPAEKPGSAH